MASQNVTFNPRVVSLTISPDGVFVEVANERVNGQVIGVRGYRIDRQTGTVTARDGTTLTPISGPLRTALVNAYVSMQTYFEAEADAGNHQI